MLIAILGWINLTSYLRHVMSLTASISPGPIAQKTALYAGIGQVLLLTLPLLPLGMLWPSPPYKTIFRAWALAGQLILLLLPIQLIDPIDFQAQAALQTLLILLFAGYLSLIDRKNAGRITPGMPSNNLFAPGESPHGQHRRPFIAFVLLALLISAACAYPWMRLGALGSPVDTALVLVFGIALGWVSGFLLHRFLLPTLYHNTSAGFWKNFLLCSLGTGGALVILSSATSFPFGSIQLMYMVVLPTLSGAIVALALRLHSPASSSIQNISPLALLIGLVASLPLAFFDIDELALIIASSAGEVLGYAAHATFLSTLIALLASFLAIGILWRQRRAEHGYDSLAISPNPGTSLVTPILAASTLLCWTFLAWTYLSSGRPGFYGEHIFVILKSQADVSPAENIPDYNQRRTFVYQTLVAHANTTQAGLRQSLDRLGIAYTPYYLVNALEVPDNPFLELWFYLQPEVDRVLHSPRLRPLPESPPLHTGDAQAPTEPPWNLKLIHADQAWQEFGAKGRGIVVGQSDSGAQSDHPELADGYRGGPGDHNYNWYDPWYATTAPVDIGGHGTHTLGTILGRHTGVAPEATWIACVNLARNLANPALYLSCMQFMLAPFPLQGDALADGDPTRGALVLNNSWGCPDIEGCDTNTFLYALHALRAAGIFFVASAGNDGPNCATLNDPPSIYADAFAVGAIDGFGELAFFSSIGPVESDGSQRIKPDIVAPGVEVLSSTPGSTYAVYSGTSMAGPHVVGVVALMWSANPALIGDITRTEQILHQTARPYTGYLPNCPGASSLPSIATGYGIVDAYAAVKTAIQAP